MIKIINVIILHGHSNISGIMCIFAPPQKGSEALADNALRDILKVFYFFFKKSLWYQKGALPLQSQIFRG
jgi:hypothetical protein